jgi:hypothetical protein
MGQPVTGSKTGTTRISISTSSLEMLIGTFMVEKRDTQTFFLLGDHNNTYAQLTSQIAGRIWFKQTQLLEMLL